MLQPIWDSHPTAFIAAAIGCALIWLVLAAKVLRAGNLGTGQKVGWLAGLTFLFPVFSLLFLALDPVEPPPSKPAAPVEPYKSERHLWGRM
jgi:hypothetical protein